MTPILEVFSRRCGVSSTMEDGIAIESGGKRLTAPNSSYASCSYNFKDGTDIIKDFNDCATFYIRKLLEDV